MLNGVTVCCNVRIEGFNKFHDCDVVVFVVVVVVEVVVKTSM